MCLNVFWTCPILVLIFFVCSKLLCYVVENMQNKKTNMNILNMIYVKSNLHVRNAQCACWLFVSFCFLFDFYVCGLF